MLRKKFMCLCATILPLFQDNCPNSAPHGVPQVPHVLQDKHPQGLHRVWCAHSGLRAQIRVGAGDCLSG